MYIFIPSNKEQFVLFVFIGMILFLLSITVRFDACELFGETFNIRYFVHMYIYFDVNSEVSNKEAIAFYR